jgi:hypothetical protein
VRRVLEQKPYHRQVVVKIMLRPCCEFDVWWNDRSDSRLEEKAKNVDLYVVGHASDCLTEERSSL